MPDPTTTILNIDDYAPARYVRTRILSRAGYEVVEGDSAAQALERASTASLLLLDVKLPDLDGFMVCERVKKLYPALPVVMVTSVYRTAQARRDAFDAGADAYLLDPVEPDRLIRTISSLVTEVPRPDEAAELPWVITDAVGAIEDLSPAMSKLLNLSRRGARGRNLTNFFVENRPRLISELLRAAEGTIIDRLTTIQPRDRRQRRVRVDVSAVPAALGERIRLRWVIDPDVSDTEIPES